MDVVQHSLLMQLARERGIDPRFPSDELGALIAEIEAMPSPQPPRGVSNDPAAAAALIERRRLAGDVPPAPFRGGPLIVRAGHTRFDNTQ